MRDLGSIKGSQILRHWHTAFSLGSLAFVPGQGGGLLPELSIKGSVRGFFQRSKTFPISVPPHCHHTHPHTLHTTHTPHTTCHTPHTPHTTHTHTPYTPHTHQTPYTPHTPHTHTPHTSSYLCKERATLLQPFLFLSM